MTYPPSLRAVLSGMRTKGYRVFDSPAGYDLNIVGIRTDSIEGDRFDDWLTVFYRVSDAWAYLPMPATTDPGTYYRRNPINVKGTAVMVPGQYRGAYQIGKHKGYPALRQIKAIPVYRDANRDGKLDTSGQEIDDGIHYTNIHRARQGGASATVGKWSAGCQVVQDAMHFRWLMELARAAAGLYGDVFTYTLLRESDLGYTGSPGA